VGRRGDERDADPFGESGINPMTGSEENFERDLLGAQTAGEGEAGSPGSGGASPYLRQRVSPSLFDLNKLAENGLRRGYTTGTCATAAVKAALLKLVCHETPPEVRVTLPDSLQYLAVPIDRISEEANGEVRADVIKDGGDDPDQTHRARIFARVRRNSNGQIVFQRGEGVGVVTQPGLQLRVGEPAINPVPRKMMTCAVHEVLGEGDGPIDLGFDLQIGCESGEEIAKRTFNPRLGIEGGISILGTTGVVEPKSTAAFAASIEVYVRVALGDHPGEIVVAPGNLGQRFARSFLHLSLKRVVQTANFIGVALRCVERTLEENGHRLPRLWVVGHPGKLAKILDGVDDTHSAQSRSAVDAVCRLADRYGIPSELLKLMAQSRTVEGQIELLRAQPFSAEFWSLVEKRIAAQIAAQLKRVDLVSVRLFQMDGQPLGGKETLVVDTEAPAREPPESGKASHRGHGGA
jgi:cobalt-precorrin-5B (C1)-methyltransferase